MAGSSNALTIIGTVTSHVVLITALLYYFGWVYTHSFLGYFGIDPSLVGYNTADYVLRSMNVAFHPFIYAAFGALVMFGFHRLVIAPALMNARPDLPPPSNIVTNDGNDPTGPRATRLWVSRTASSLVSWTKVWGRWKPGPSGVRRFMGVLQVVAIIFAAAVLTGLIFSTQIGAPLGILLPLSLIISVTLLRYVGHLSSEYPDAFTAMTPSRPTPPSRAYTLTLLTLGFVAGLWAVSLYGDSVGRRVAIDIENQLAYRSEVVIYSTDRIALQGPGIVVADITQLGTKYHYKYTGLRFLARSPDRFLLLPSEWKHGHDHVILLRDNDLIRVDFIATV
ncbi:MAG: hypothetical protein ACJ72I_19665 [Pseudonocardiaceae bacterium]